MFELKDCNAVDAIKKNKQGRTVKEISRETKIV